MDALDFLMAVTYIGLIVWGVWAQVEPPLSLLGASGETLTRVVTLGVLGFATAALAGLIVDQATCSSSRWHALWEIPGTVGLTCAWATYVSVVWLLVAGRGDPNLPPTLAVGAIVTSVLLGPFIVRLVVLFMDALATIKNAAKAREWGLLGDQTV